MSMPFYVPPEQAMRDRAEFARKGIARGRSVVVTSCAEGIVLVAENPSRTLHKLAEIYDRIAFAGVGKYTEFETMRVAGIRYADLRGYSYDRSDVTARGLAGMYAQTLGAVFTQEIKPYEVEIVLAQVGETVEDDQLYRLTFDGSVTDEHGYVGIGGTAEAVTRALADGWRPDLTVPEALHLSVEALGRSRPEGSDGVPHEHLEVALLDRSLRGRRFRRLPAPVLHRLLTT